MIGLRFVVRRALGLLLVREINRARWLRHSLDPRFLRFTFLRFPLFFFTPFPPTGGTVHVRYMNSNRNFWPVFRKQCIRALFTDPQISFFINFFIKNGSHSIIYIFKNYFATVFSVFSFQFQENKFYPNKPLVLSFDLQEKMYKRDW